MPPWRLCAKRPESKTYVFLQLSTVAGRNSMSTEDSKHMLSAILKIDVKEYGRLKSQDERDAIQIKGEYLLSLND